MSAKVVLDKVSRPGPGPDAGRAWRLAGVGAVGVGLVGAVDVALLWFPAEFGDVDWEFGTISATVDALPLMTLGVIGSGVAAVASGRAAMARIVAVAAGMIGLALVVLAAIYGLGLPIAWQGIEPGLKRVLAKAVVKTGAAGTVYVSLYMFIAWTLWRWSRR